MKLGEQKISGLYLGGEKIGKAYLGEAVVFAGKKPSRLPEGYTEVEYIQSDKRCIINPGLRYTNASSYNIFRLFIDFSFVSASTAASQGETLFTCTMTQSSSSTGSRSFQAYHLFANKFSVRAGSNSFTFDTENDERHTIDCNIKTAVLSVDEIQSSFARGSTTVTSFVPYIFSTPPNAVYSAEAKVFSCRMYSNDVIVRDFVPCIDPSGTVGLYDLVYGKFYANLGTGAFTPGPAV